MGLLKNVDYTIRPFFKKILILSLIVYLCTAWFSVGYYHGDEHFQLIEFANYKLGNATSTQLAWEFNEQIRPGFQPALVYACIQACQAIGLENSFVQAAVLRFLSMILFLLISVFFVVYAVKKIDNVHLKKATILFAFLLWFMPFLAVRFSSETWSVLFFIMGFLIIENSFNKKNTWLLYMLGGLVLGLSFQIRYQLFFMIVGYFLWQFFIQKKSVSFFLFVKIGVVISLLIGVACDYWLYSEFVFTPWLYVKSNLILNKAAEMFGSSPWWYYFTAVFNQAIFPFGLLLIVGILLFFIVLPKHVFTWITLPFIVIHFFIAHKELRFLFPLFMFAPVMFVLLLQRLNDTGWFLKNKLSVKQWFVVFGIINIVPLAVVCVKPANNAVKVLSIINKHHIEKPATCYFIEQNPMSPFGLPFTFYQLPAHVKFVAIETPDSIHCDANEVIYLYINQKSKNSNYQVDKTKYTCLFSSIPLWLKSVNFNNWIGRTTVAQLYILKK